MAKILPKNPDFKEIKYPIKVRDMHKTEKKNPSALVLLVMKMRKNIKFLYQENAV